MEHNKINPMNDNPEIGSTEKVEKVGWGIIRWTIYILLTLIIFGGVFWVLLYWSLPANNPSIIFLRNQYQDLVGKAQDSPSLNVNKIYEIQPQEPLEVGLNTYTFVGKFSKVDAEQGLIHLIGKRGKIYVFNIKSQIYIDPINTLLKFFLVDSLKDFTTGISPDSVKDPTGNLEGVLVYARSIAIINGSPQYVFGDLGIRWNDKRSLSQIEADYLKGPSVPLNALSLENTILVEFSPASPPPIVSP
jgi:hypothetical protein